MLHEQERRLEGLQICLQHVNIEFRNLSYSVSQNKGATTQKDILRGINGYFQSGHLTAILGPSGAGKTSLLNILSGFKTSGVCGTITTNGKERNIEEFRKQSSYISQEFAMLSLLTTRETLKVAADLKLHSKIKTRQKNFMIDEILQLLGLQKAQDTLVGHLSGGEKKRLSIGVELLTNPPVMFFDEPTSGLDSSSSFQAISHLKTLAQSGRTIICTIHQPSSHLFDMFDDLYVLAEGQCLYNGPVREMVIVFGEAGFQCPKYYSHADFAIEVACHERGDNVDTLILKYNKNQRDETGENHVSCQDDAANEESIMLQTVKPTLPVATVPLSSSKGAETYLQHSVPLWKQIFILMKRSVLCNARDKFMTLFRVTTHIAVGLSIGAVCYDIGNEASKTPSNAAFLFFLALTLFMLCPFITVLVYPLEASVFIREHLNNWYPLKAYYVSKLVSDFPFQILCPTLLLLGCYFLSDQPYDINRFTMLWFLCILITICGQTLGLMLGAAFDAQMGLFMIIALNIPMTLFSGFFMRLKDIPGYLQWLTYVSYFRHSFEAVMISTYGDNRTNLHCSEDFCYFKTPKKVLDEFNLTESLFEINIMVIVLWLVVSQIGLYIVLKWRIYMSR